MSSRYLYGHHEYGQCVDLGTLHALQSEIELLRLDRDKWQEAACVSLEQLSQTRQTLATVVTKAKEALIGAKFWTQDSVMGQLAALVDMVDAKLKETK